MTRIQLNAEQSRAIREAGKTIEIVDESGRRVAVLPDGWTAADIEDAKRARDSTERRWSTTEVLNHLRSIDPNGSRR